MPPRAERWLPLLIVVVGGLVYLNSFGADFVFDDAFDIVDNPQIRNFGPAIAPRAGSYRPVVYLSFALNYALAGAKSAWSYHAVNLAVHLIAALALYGIVRRTLLLHAVGRARLLPSREQSATESARQEPRPPTDPGAAPWLALATALLWVVHPLQTEAVTYIVHRYESFMGMFYLLTLYCVIRGATANCSGRSRDACGTRLAWYIGAIVFCALGMGSKEVMITAPVLIFLYDLIFLVPAEADPQGS